jgi:hypothetical protein
MWTSPYSFLSKARLPQSDVQLCLFAWIRQPSCNVSAVAGGKSYSHILWLLEGSRSGEVPVLRDSCATLGGLHGTVRR